MKKIFLLFLLISTTFYAQITTSPATPTTNDEITLTLTTTGTGLDGYTGDIYAHTGVNVNGTQWSNVISNWGNNADQPKFTKVNNTTYTLTISPNVHSFYSVNISQTISEINIVARSASGSQQTSNIHLQIFPPELNVQFSSHTNNQAVELNQVVSLTAEATIDANLELFAEGSSIQTANNTRAISANHTFTSSGLKTVKVTASEGGTTKEHEINLYVKTPTQNATKPNVGNGITINADNSVTFVLLAPNKNDVFLIGDFNDWELNPNYQLKKDGDYFWITLTGLDTSTEFAYQYFIDYDKKVADPYAEKVLDEHNDQYISATNYPDLKDFPAKASGIVSTFVINENEYTWQNTSFTKPAKKDLVIYELLVRDFSEDDSYQAVIDKLDYLQDLGINAIEFMPVNEFEGNDSWGYNVSNFFALDKAYGTKNKFKELIDKCHQRGIAVILDVVFNHSYSQCPLLQMYDFDISGGTTSNNPFYNDDHNYEEGGLRFGFDFNHESNYTKDYFKDVMTYWIEEYKVDGFRFDFTKGFTNTYYSISGGDQWGNNYNQDRIDILNDYANYIWNNHDNDFYVILEHLANDDEEKALANAGMMLWGKMTHNYNQSTMGWNDQSDIGRAYYKNRDFNNPHLVSFMESHDEERLMYKNIQHGNSNNSSHNVKNLNIALSRQELAGALYFTIPGPKMIWQFGELGYDISIDQGGRTSRKPVKWDYYDVAERKKIYDVWAELIQLKKANEVFSTENVILDVGNLAKRINLNHSSNDVVILGNFDVNIRTFNPNFSTTGTWYEYFTNTQLNVTNVLQPISLQPGEYRIYSKSPLNTTLSNSDDLLTKNVVKMYPNPSTDRIFISKNVKNLTIFDLAGKQVKSFNSTQSSYDIASLNEGLYFVRITTNENITVVKKLLKQ